MNKHKQSDPKRVKRQQAKKARKEHRRAMTATKVVRNKEKRTAAFRVEGIAKIRTATRALLAGAAAAGIDITAADVNGKFNSHGDGELTVDGRVAPANVQRAYKHATAILEGKGHGGEKQAVEATVAHEPGTLADTEVVYTGEDGMQTTKPWSAKLKGAWLKTAAGNRRAWATKKAAEQALQRASLV